MTLWSGPEFISYLSLVIAAIGLIIDLLKFFHKDRKDSAKVRIVQRYKIKEPIVKEEILEIEFPLTDAIIERINKNLEKSLGVKKD